MTDTIVAIILVAVFLLISLLCYALCVASARWDRLEERREMELEWMDEERKRLKGETDA